MNRRPSVKHIIFWACLLGLLLLSACKSDGAGEIKYLDAEAVPTAQTLRMVPVESAPVSPAPADITVRVDEITPAPVLTREPMHTPAPTPAPTSRNEGLIANMTIEEKIGQLVMFGFNGTGSVPTDFKTIMHTYEIGNVILYGFNIDRDQSDGGFSRCKRLTGSLRSVNAGNIPLMIAIDVEGGNVIRFKWDRNLLSAAELGKRNDVSTAVKQFERIGTGLLSAGIDMDLAPVMDIAEEPGKTFLQSRIISSSPSVASDIGAACIEGLHNSGCLSLIKHFPGHGATDSDSHKTTPVIKKTLEQLERYELVPFAAAVKAGADGVMVGHLSYPKIDPEHIASQSYFFITELLREQLGFEGIVMSDDFRMEGLNKKYPLKEAAVNFILAGGDIILCGPNYAYQKEIMEGLHTAYKTGALTEERIDESLMRILAAKERFA